MLEPEPPRFLFIALLVSGGHTMLAAVHGVGQYQILGCSVDDAAGEAFDKTAKLLGLPYPERSRARRKLAQSGRPGRFKLPAADARSAGSRFQLQGFEDRGRRCDSRSGSSTTPTRADVARGVSAGRRRYARGEVPPRASSRPASTRSVVAGGVGANRAACARRSRALGKKLGVAVSYPRLDVLHRQRRDDRVRRVSVALAAGESRRPGDPRDCALAA